MRYADLGLGNYGDDASLRGIEQAEDHVEGEEHSGFGIPGTSAIGTVGVNTGGPDGSDTHFNAGESGRMVDLVPPDAETPFELLDFRDGFGGNKMSLSSRIAFVMENGEPFCNHCEKHYVPVSLGRTACSNCGCGKPQDDHGLEHVEGPTAKDLAPRDIVKQDKLASVDDYLATFHASEGNGSKLFYEGYSDAAAGKPMDEDQALLSKDYYNGYEQYKFYNKTPQQSVGQELIDMKPNSNQIPRAGDTNNGELNKGGLDTGPFELTASRNPFPVDVIQNFFEV